jgi:hypothetical protein
MVSEPDDQPVHSRLPSARQAQDSPPDQSARARSDTRRWRVRRSPAHRKAEHRLGWLEVLLLALIALGVAITGAMAVIDPAA